MTTGHDGKIQFGDGDEWHDIPSFDLDATGRPMHYNCKCRLEPIEIDVEIDTEALDALWAAINYPMMTAFHSVN